MEKLFKESLTESMGGCSTEADFYLAYTLIRAQGNVKDILINWDQAYGLQTLSPVFRTLIALCDKEVVYVF